MRQVLGKFIRFVALLLACFLSTLTLPAPVLGSVIPTMPNTAYDATVAYDCHENTASAYEDAARPPTAEEKHASGAPRTFLSRIADLLAAKDAKGRDGTPCRLMGVDWKKGVPSISGSVQGVTECRHYPFPSSQAPAWERPCL